MDTNYRNAIATHGGGLVTHIGLVNGSGTEISGGTYARQTVTWLSPAGADAVIRPNANLSFNVPSGQTVAGWRGFDASTSGTNYGGAALPSQAFATDGTYVLNAAASGIRHPAG